MADQESDCTPKLGGINELPCVMVLSALLVCMIAHGYAAPNQSYPISGLLVNKSGENL